MKISIDVYFKSGILDPEAQAIFNSLKSLNFKKTKDISIHKNFIINLDINDEKIALETANNMAKDLLVNSVIEDYKIKILK